MRLASLIQGIDTTALFCWPSLVCEAGERYTMSQSATQIRLARPRKMKDPRHEEYASRPTITMGATAFPNRAEPCVRLWAMPQREEGSRAITVREAVGN